MRLLDWYDQRVTSTHLDVGVGTGYFLDRCRFPTSSPRITLVDLNENCLAAAAARIRRYERTTMRADVLRPFEMSGGPFASISLNYVLHCLPGDLAGKACVFDHLTRHLALDGVLFGSTLIGHGVRYNLAARSLAAFYNRKRVFSNAKDRLDVLESVLRARFAHVRIETQGCVALFAARRDTG